MSQGEGGGGPAALKMCPWGWVFGARIERREEME